MKKVTRHKRKVNKKYNKNVYREQKGHTSIKLKLARKITIENYIKGRGRKINNKVLH